MNLLFIVLTLLSFNAVGGERVYSPPDSVIDAMDYRRAGGESEALVTYDGARFGWVRFDCSQPRMYEKDRVGDGVWVPVSSSPHAVTFTAISKAACSKWWEVWKR